MWTKKVVIASMVLGALAPVTAFAGNPHSIAWNKVVYPYKDLPGVTAPKPPEEKFKCATTVAEISPDFYGWRHAYPRLVYVCDQNGVVSASTRAPNYSYWQYNDRNR
jgi:hypothetical protein